VPGKYVVSPTVVGSDRNPHDDPGWADALWRLRLNHKKSLRAANGLPEPTGASSVGDDGHLRQLGEYRRGYRTALLAGDRSAAVRALRVTDDVFEQMNGELKR
jgi:hypothetical protein